MSANQNKLLFKKIGFSKLRFQLGQVQQGVKQGTIYVCTHYETVVGAVVDFKAMAEAAYYSQIRQAVIAEKTKTYSMGYVREHLTEILEDLDQGTYCVVIQCRGNACMVLIGNRLMRGLAYYLQRHEGLDPDQLARLFLVPGVRAILAGNGR